MRQPDEGPRLHHGVCRRGPDNRSSETDVRGGEAPAIPCLRAGCPTGGRGERGILLSILRSGRSGSLLFFSRGGGISCPYWIFGSGFRDY